MFKDDNQEVDADMEMMLEHRSELAEMYKGAERIIAIAAASSEGFKTLLQGLKDTMVAAKDCFLKLQEDQDHLTLCVEGVLSAGFVQCKWIVVPQNH